MLWSTIWIFSSIDVWKYARPYAIEFCSFSISFHQDGAHPLQQRGVFKSSHLLPDKKDHTLSSSSSFTTTSLFEVVRAASPIFPKPDGGGDTCDVEPSSVQKWDDNWDLRDPAFLGLTEYPKATRHLILIRHGQYNLESDDDADRKLTELGRRQLQLTGQRLRELSCQNNVKYDKIIVSTMTRALESADIIAGCLPEVPRGEKNVSLRRGAWLLILSMLLRVVMFWFLM